MLCLKRDKGESGVAELISRLPEFEYDYECVLLVLILLRVRTDKFSISGNSEVK